MMILGIAVIVAIVGGLLLGNKLGTDKYNSEVAITTPVAEDTPFINVALEQLGNKGGEPFWKWFGFGTRQEWCACFVSWCEDSQNYIDEGIAPRFAMGERRSQLVQGQRSVEVPGSTPVANDLIFFDWESDSVLDHVGIVTAVVDDKVYTVEGNSSDLCRQKRYTLDSPVIAGYAHIAI